MTNSLLHLMLLNPRTLHSLPDSRTRKDDRISMSSRRKVRLGESALAATKGRRNHS